MLILATAYLSSVVIVYYYGEDVLDDQDKKFAEELKDEMPFWTRLCKLIVAFGWPLILWCMICQAVYEWLRGKR